MSLAILGFYFQQQEQKRAELVEKEEILQLYYDRLSSLLVDKNILAIAVKVHNGSEQSNNSTSFEEKELLDAAVDIIRARTLSILRRFSDDSGKKSNVIQFLIDAEVVKKAKLNLAECNLSGVDLKEAELSNVILNGVDFDSAKLGRVNFCNTKLSGANFSGADLSAAILSEADLSGSNLSSANLSRADLREVNLSFAKLNRAQLIRADLTDANLSKADLNRYSLHHAKLCRTTLPTGIELDGNRDCA